MVLEMILILSHLKYFDSLIGLYERFLYWTISKKNFVEQVHTLQNNLPSIEYLFITRMQIGFRIYEYENEALAYLKPILSKMRNNLISPEISTIIPNNKRAGNHRIHILSIIKSLF
jgi:hypothetical protein